MKKLLLTLLVGLFVANPVAAQERGTAEEAMELVNKFIAYYNENGAEAAYAEVQKADGQFKVKDLYIFVDNIVSDNETILLAHGGNPSLVGQNTFVLKDADGKAFIEEFRKVALSEAGEGWVDYKWPHPETKKVENKSSFVKKITDTIYVGCGISK